MGYARAADLIFTSRTVGAEEAFRLGLLDRLESFANRRFLGLVYAEALHHLVEHAAHRLGPGLQPKQFTPA